MDGRLLEAAIRGNKQTLVELLREDPLILDQAMDECTGKESPLHLGALYGHVDFVREILLQKRQLVRELNYQGQSPLHLASARGHVGVVKEILSADPYACFVRDRDGMIPLHVAAIKGQVEVLEELVNAKSVTAFLLTDGGEPILHMCAKNKQFKALEKLVELVKDDDFVNLKDSKKNNILHLLSAKKQTELIRFLLKKHNRALEVNAVNTDGCTPLDISLKRVSGLARLKSDIALITAGAKTATPIFGKGKTKMLNDNYGSWFMEALLVVALLMINVAFQAALNPPGGVLQDPSNATSTSPNAVWQVTGNITLPNTTLPNAIWRATGFGTLPDDTLPDATHVGQSIMSVVDRDQYKEFSKANNLSIIFSMLVIEILLMRCFVDCWLLDIMPIFLTSMSVVAMVSSYHVSHSFVSVT
ncbi:ankyrin repeat-containing-like protein [Cinnamomum micranthum f. kanehirae]|uniref:Ankyrin repeat-containing-like protein n=1 Tax=Cinnamomum micranthum f. kanehirae TaxID=337451 RepID=A0A443P0J1_9MAGN|nr:ankyrin repeat-containing-like protein [Cinnamomum micranthum f. kanehirae]